MDIILLEKVDSLGDLGDKVSVKSGFARNYLIPQGKAQFATPENLAQFEARRAEFEKQAAQALAEAQARKEQLDSADIHIISKVGAEGKLFGSIGPREVAEAISAKGIALEKREVRMPTGSIRTIGEHVVGIHLHSDVDIEVTVTVAGEE